MLQWIVWKAAMSFIKNIGWFDYYSFCNNAILVVIIIDMNLRYFTTEGYRGHCSSKKVKKKKTKQGKDNENGENENGENKK